LKRRIIHLSSTQDSKTSWAKFFSFFLYCSIIDIEYFSWYVSRKKWIFFIWRNNFLLKSKCDLPEVNHQEAYLFSAIWDRLCKIFKSQLKDDFFASHSPAQNLKILSPKESPIFSSQFSSSIWHQKNWLELIVENIPLSILAVFLAHCFLTMKSESIDPFCLFIPHVYGWHLESFLVTIRGCSSLHKGRLDLCFSLEKAKILKFSHLSLTFLVY